MTTVELPYLVIAAPPAAQLDVVALERALRERVDGEVRFDAGTRAVYSTDASNFRQVPIGVVVPRTPEAAVAAIAVARGYGRRCCRAAAEPAWPASAPTRHW